MPFNALTRVAGTYNSNTNIPVTLANKEQLSPEPGKVQAKLTKSRGFSLIELMIVITIMGLLASIVMPETFKMLEQHQAQLEQKKLIDFFKEQKVQAYLMETPVTIEFAGSEINSSLGHYLIFEFINTDHQVIEISQLGNFRQDFVSYQLRNRDVELLLGDLK